MCVWLCVCVNNTCWISKIAWVAWSQLCASRDIGDFGIKDIKALNNALLIKWKCPFCQSQPETASHLFFTCDKVLPLWWEFFSWVKEDRVLHYSPMDNFLQHSTTAGRMTTNRRWKIWWLAATKSIWKLRNDMVFHDQSFDISKLVDNTNFLTWSWLKGWEKDFNVPFHQWSSTTSLAFI